LDAGPYSSAFKRQPSGDEAERHEWRADVLGFIRDHLESLQVYRLAEADLTFGEILPEKPGWLEQDEPSERAISSSP
jgi:hypothetical protein